MVTLSRRHGGAGPQKDICDNDWELLLAVEEPEGGVRRVASWVSAAKVRDGERESLGQLLDGVTPEELVRAFAAEVDGPVPMAPTRLIIQPLDAGRDGLDLQWADFQISQEQNGGIRVEFSIPDSTERVTLEMVAAVEWFLESDVTPDGRPDAVMQYAACPRLKISGTLDGQAISGQGWFDQQWGSDGWFVPDTERGYFFWLGMAGDQSRQWSGYADLAWPQYCQQ